MQIVVLNEPEPVVLNIIVPVGLCPVTVAVHVVDAPTVNDGQDTLIVGIDWLTVTDVVPRTSVLFMLPEYVAVIVGVPKVSEYVIVHDPEDSVHWLFVGVNEPVESEVLNDTVPVGLYPPVTVAVHVVDTPIVNDGQDTLIVGADWLTVMMPET
jgi:uncharacterized membrane protein